VELVTAPPLCACYVTLVDSVALTGWILLAPRIHVELATAPPLFACYVTLVDSVTLTGWIPLAPRIHVELVTAPPLFACYVTLVDSVTHPDWMDSLLYPAYMWSWQQHTPSLRPLCDAVSQRHPDHIKVVKMAFGQLDSITTCNGTGVLHRHRV
jgi:hypothetical protein